MELIHERENLKLASAEIELAQFEHQVVLRAFKRKINQAEGDEDLLLTPRPDKRRKSVGSSAGSQRSKLKAGLAPWSARTVEEMHKVKDRVAGVKARIEADYTSLTDDALEQWEDATEGGYQPRPEWYLYPGPNSFWREAERTPPMPELETLANCVGFSANGFRWITEQNPPPAVPGRRAMSVRKRMGRGGRIMIDRIGLGREHHQGKGLGKDGRLDRAYGSGDSDSDDVRTAIKLAERFSFDLDVSEAFPLANEPAIVDDYSPSYLVDRVRQLYSETDDGLFQLDSSYLDQAASHASLPTLRQQKGSPPVVFGRTPLRLTKGAEGLFEPGTATSIGSQAARPAEHRLGQLLVQSQSDRKPWNGLDTSPSDSEAYQTAATAVAAQARWLPAQIIAGQNVVPHTLTSPSPARFAHDAIRMVAEIIGDVPRRFSVVALGMGMGIGTGTGVAELSPPSSPDTPLALTAQRNRLPMPNYPFQAQYSPPHSPELKMTPLGGPSFQPIKTLDRMGLPGLGPSAFTGLDLPRQGAELTGRTIDFPAPSSVLPQREERDRVAPAESFTLQAGTVGNWGPRVGLVMPAMRRVGGGGATMAGPSKPPSLAAVEEEGAGEAQLGMEAQAERTIERHAVEGVCRVESGQLMEGAWPLSPARLTPPAKEDRSRTGTVEPSPHQTPPPSLERSPPATVPLSSSSTELVAVFEGSATTKAAIRAGTSEVQLAPSLPGKRLAEAVADRAGDAEGAEAGVRPRKRANSKAEAHVEETVLQGWRTNGAGRRGES